MAKDRLKVAHNRVFEKVRRVLLVVERQSLAKNERLDDGAIRELEADARAVAD